MPCQTGTTSRQRHQSPTPETSTDGNPSGTGFRSRLQSAPSECHPTTSALDFRDVPKNVIDQFQADFVFVPSPPPTTTAKLPAAKVSEKTNEAILQLTDVFTQAGSATHAAAVEHLSHAHEEILHQISQFVTLSLTALEHNDTLYGNIAYSLSNTLCSNDNHSSATVAVHLAKLIEWLNQTEDKLKSLSRDWGACLDAEDKAWAQLSNYPNPTPHVTDLGNSFGTKESAAFRKEAEEIFEAKSQTIEDIEEEYKDQVHAETANILEHMVE